MRLVLKNAAVTAAAVLGLCTLSAPASAQATRTWIASDGDDGAPCTRIMPCKTFQGAFAKTADGGEIDCLDSGGYGSLTINKSISIICTNTLAGVMVGNGDTIDVQVPNGYVLIDGLDLEGLGNITNGPIAVSGVNILDAAVVHVRNTKIRGFRYGYGIAFQPHNGNSQLFVDNVTISEGGMSGNTSSGGILIRPSAGITASATITNTQIVDNINLGIRADITGNAGAAILASIDNAVLSNDGAGILIKAPSGTGTVKLMLTDSIVTLNSGQGIIANGTQTSVQARIGNTRITNNGTGIVVLGTAQLQSYGDNRVDGNITDGSFSGTIVRK